MARIRSLKPEFWTDAEVVACSAFARLFFIGCWNHADDYGVLKDDPAGLRLKILPADDVDPHALVCELVSRNLLLRRVAPDGSPVLVVRTFCQNQKLDKRTVGRYGDPQDFTLPAESRTIPPPPADSPPHPPETVLGPSSLDRTGTDRTGTENPSVELVPAESSPTATVWDAYQQSTGRTRARLDQKRRRVITEALRHYPLEDVVDAVQGWIHFPHNRGENERGTVYNDIELLLKDSAHIERFRDAQRNPESHRRPTGIAALNVQARELERKMS